MMLSISHGKIGRKIMLRLHGRPPMAVIIGTIFFFWVYVFPVAEAVVAPFVGSPQVSPSSILTGIQTEITITSLIAPGPYDPPVIPTGVDLQKVDANNNFIATLGTMHDDGNHGDTAAGDGVFSLLLPVNEPQTGELRLRVSAPFQGLVMPVLSGVTVVPIRQVANQHPTANAGSNQTIQLTPDRHPPP